MSENGINKSQIKIEGRINKKKADDTEGHSDKLLFFDEDESDTDEEEEEVQPGDIVWGLLGRHWYPGKVCNLTDVPSNMKHKFQTSSSKFIVYWYGNKMYSLVTKVERLGEKLVETLVDAKRESRSDEMQKLYNMALAVYHYFFFNEY